MMNYSPKEVIEALEFFFPGLNDECGSLTRSQDSEMVIQRICDLQTHPLDVTHLNQMLHLVHEAGVTEDLFRYYFLVSPRSHPYPVEKVEGYSPKFETRAISSLDQLKCGLRRFYIDALLLFGNIRSAFSELRVMDNKHLESFFSLETFDPAKMASRRDIFPLNNIPKDDRYLISEMACKAYSALKPGESVLLKRTLVEEFRKNGRKRIKVSYLLDKDSRLAKNNPLGQRMFEFSADEFLNETIEYEEDIEKYVSKIFKRFNDARPLAIANTRLYLSIVNELDVYIATSMRKRDDFRNMAKDCNLIFKRDALRKREIRYFDPTMSAADGHEDKGLIECLMVKCAKAVLYFAGESDSFGKDAEMAMAMSLGKPVVILCPRDEKGKGRMEFFRDVHPLSRLIRFDTGVACGAMVTQNPDVAGKLLERIFSNTLEYDLDHSGDGYFRVKERLTGSVVRLQTNSRILQESFWNNYHGVK